MADLYDFERALREYELTQKEQELKQKEQALTIEFMQHSAEARDIEQDACMHNISERLDRMGNDVEQLKKDMNKNIQDIREDVKTSIADIKTTIPTLFDNTINKLMARMFKWVLLGIGLILITIILLFTKPLILKGIDNVKTYVEQKEDVKW